MFVLFIGNTGSSFVPSWQRGIPGKNPCTCDKNRPVVTGLLKLFLRHCSIIILYFQITLRGVVTVVEKEMFVKCPCLS